MSTTESYKKIDAHGHIGPSYLGPQSDLRDYVSNASKIGVVASIVSPGPTPVVIKDGNENFPCLWKYESGKVIYFQQQNEGGESKQTEANSNPYHDVNVEMFKKVKGVREIKMYVMPIHHPILDTTEEVKQMVKVYPSIALKLHGISTFTGPEDVKMETIDLLRKEGKPIIVHTDTYTGAPQSPIHIAYQKNDPIKWVNWARQTGVKTLITHGARLSDEAIALANQTPNVKVGIAPDLLIMSEPERLFIKTSDYLTELLSRVNPEKLLFDIDFGWNVSERNRWDLPDWKMHERIQETATKLGIKSDHLESIFYKNAQEFYNI